MQIEVIHRPDDERYVVMADGREAGFAIYRGEGDRVEIPYTEVAPELGGRGIGSAMVEGVLEDLRARGVTEIVPSCSFVARVMAGDERWRDLLAARTTT